MQLKQLTKRVKANFGDDLEIPSSSGLANALLSKAKRQILRLNRRSRG